jgi:hypothetical protein
MKSIPTYFYLSLTNPESGKDIASGDSCNPMLQDALVAAISLDIEIRIANPDGQTL